jgi:hypothetical protein
LRICLDVAERLGFSQRGAVGSRATQPRELGRFQAPESGGALAVAMPVIRLLVSLLS